MVARRPSDPPRDLLVVGHINLDRFLGLRAFPSADRTVPVRSNRLELGGTAANIAWVAARYGVETGLAAHVGADFPPAFLERLARAGIDVRAVATAPARGSPTCYILEDAAGGQRTLIDQGAMADDAAPYALGDALGEYSWVHLTTGPVAAGLDLARRARAKGLRVAIDPAQEIHYRWSARDLRSLLGTAEILFGNASEVARARTMLGLRRDADLLALVPLVVRTEGRRGAVALARSGSVRVPAVAPRRRRTLVGAGDAFRGGFYAAWFAGQPLERTLAAGARAAARWIEGER